jgi:hypothetical protein
MANLYGVNYTKSDIDVPVEIIPHAEVNGKVESAYDEYTFAAEFTNGDVLYMSKIPAGARVKRVSVVCPSLGTTGSCDVGVVGDVTAFKANLALNGGAVAFEGPSLEKFTSESQLILTCDATTDAATGLKIQVSVEFTVA